jgi:pSer/pThr/pTyr-binding forkhead associated (FHA) protein
VTVAIGPDKGRVFNLKEGAPVVIGRRQSHLVMTDHNVSRRHAQFAAKDGRWYVSDAGSTNGTFVNGTRITEPTPLKGGDQIQIGRSILIFHGTPATGRKTRPDAPVRTSANTPRRDDADALAYDVISGHPSSQSAPQLDSLEVYIREGAKRAPRQERPHVPALSRRPDDAPSANPSRVGDTPKTGRGGPRPHPVANPKSDAADQPPQLVEPLPTLRISRRPPSVESPAVVDDAPPVEAVATNDHTIELVADVAAVDQSVPRIPLPRGEAAMDVDAERIETDVHHDDAAAEPDHHETPHLTAFDSDDPWSFEPNALEGRETGEARHGAQEPIDAAIHVDAASAAGWVEIDDDGSSMVSYSTGAWESPHKLRYDPAGAAAASAAVLERGAVQPVDDSDARPAEPWRTLALAVEAEPTTRVTPPEDQDPFEDDAPRPAPPSESEPPPPPAVQPAIEIDAPDEVETEAVATAPETQTDFAFDDGIDDPDNHGSSSLVYEAEQAAAEFEALRQPVLPADPRTPAQSPTTPPRPTTGKARPELPLEQTSAVADELPAELPIRPGVEEEDEDYDYYAWEERQRLATRRKVKIISVTIVITALVALAVSNLTLVWMQLATEDAPAAPGTSGVAAPLAEDATEPAPADTLPDDPESRERNMQDIFSAVKRHLPEDQQPE